MTTAVITQNSTAQNATADDIYTGVTDTRLAKDSPTLSFNTNASLEASNTSSSVQRTTLIKFTGLSNIPSGATITSATLWLRIETSSATYNVDLRRVLLDWTSSATWNTKDGTNSWNSSGCRGDGTDRVSTPMDSPSVGATAGTWYSWDCTQYVQDIVDGTNTDYGLHLERADTGNDGAAKKFNSSDSNNGYRPELVVVYTASSGTTITASGISSAGAFGSPSISTGNVDLLPFGILTSEIIGTPLISSIYEIIPTSVISGEIVGSHSIFVGSVSIDATSITTREIFGTTTINTGIVSLFPNSISSDELFGIASISSAIIIITSDIASLESVSSPSIGTGVVYIGPSNIATSESFGWHIVNSNGQFIVITGVNSDESFGALNLTTGLVNILTVGIDSALAFGTVVVDDGLTPVLIYKTIQEYVMGETNASNVGDGFMILFDGDSIDPDALPGRLWMWFESQGYSQESLSEKLKAWSLDNLIQ